MPVDGKYSGLNAIVGEQLSAVTFVMDYLQLWFDGPGVNVTAPLTVTADGKAVVSWEAGFRDHLCAQIAKRVIDVERVPGERLAFAFEDGSTFSISLRLEDRTSVEAYYAHHFGDGSAYVE